MNKRFRTCSASCKASEKKENKEIEHKRMKRTLAHCPCPSSVNMVRRLFSLDIKKKNNFFPLSIVVKDFYYMQC